MSSHYCPACGASLVGAPLRCTLCRWHLISLATWQGLPPAQQGYALYMQASWPTSELKDQRNPYAEGTADWTAFRAGEQRAMIDVQDGEE